MATRKTETASVREKVTPTPAFAGVTEAILSRSLPLRARRVSGLSQRIFALYRPSNDLGRLVASNPCSSQPLSRMNVVIGSHANGAPLLHALTSAHSSAVSRSRHSSAVSSFRWARRPGGGKALSHACVIAFAYALVEYRSWKNFGVAAVRLRWDGGTCFPQPAVRPGTPASSVSD